MFRELVGARLAPPALGCALECRGWTPLYRCSGTIRKILSSSLPAATRPECRALPSAFVEAAPSRGFFGVRFILSFSKAGSLALRLPSLPCLHRALSAKGRSEGSLEVLLVYPEQHEGPLPCIPAKTLPPRSRSHLGHYTLAATPR